VLQGRDDGSLGIAGCRRYERVDLGSSRLPQRVDSPVGHHRAALSRCGDRQAITDEPEQPCPHQTMYPVDVDAHELEERMSRRLHIRCENVRRIAFGQKSIRTDDLSGVIRANSNQVRRPRP